MIETKPYKGKDPKGFLAILSDSDRNVVQGIRRVIFDAIPDVEEVVKWGTLIYEKDGIICAIMVHKDHTNLQFWRGAELKDEEHLLEGTGKGMRHLTFASPADIKTRQLTPLLKEAGALK